MTKELKTNLLKFLVDNKSTIIKVAAGVGVTAIVAASAMGLTGCDKNSLFDGEQTTPTYSYEEYESALSKLYEDELSKSLEGEIELRYFGLNFGTQDGQEFVNGTLGFYDKSDNYVNVLLPNLPLTPAECIELRDNLPQDALIMNEKWKQRVFSIELSKIDEQTKTKLLKIYFDKYAEQNPSKVEDLTLEN